MLSKRRRMTRREFDRAFAGGRRVHTPHAQIISLEAPSLKVAAVVSKKVARGAVSRNRLRRQVYAALAQVMPPRGHHIIVLKPSVKAVASDRLVAILRSEVGACLNTR